MIRTYIRTDIYEHIPIYPINMIDHIDTYTLSCHVRLLKLGLLTKC